MIERGLYRHFKGNYYFLLSIARDSDGDMTAIYVNVLHPEFGYFSRKVSKWDTDVSSREDNVTKQVHRFEKVSDLSVRGSISDASTEELIKELSVRRDSPLQSLDLENLNNLVECTDYVIGEYYPLSKSGNDDGVWVLNSFATKKEAFDSFLSGGYPLRANVYKRTYLKVIE